jgi:2-oxoisovalerate dehydrogenase E1 component
MRGKASIRRTGSDLTILTYLSMVTHSLEATERTGIDAEVIDLRWLDRASLDWETIEASVRKTRRVLIAEQGALGTSYGGWLADELQRRLFDWLDQPIQRVTGGEASPTISKVLERASIAGVDTLVKAIQQSVQEHIRPATFEEAPDLCGR